MSELALLAVIASVVTLGGLWHLRALSPNLMLILIYLFVVGNTEFLLTLFNGELPESLFFIEVEDLEYATVLFDMGLLAMAAGMWIARKHWQESKTGGGMSRDADALASACSGVRAVLVYAVLALFTAALRALITGPMSPLAQLFLPVLMLRFFPIYVLAYRYFRNGRDGPLLLGLASFEIVVNLSYFASFGALFVVIAAALMQAVRDGARFQWLTITTVAVFMSFVMSAWTYVKGDFREYLSAGEVAQIDTRTLPEKLDFMQGRIAGIGVSELSEGMNAAVLRIAYNGFFAATTSYVPQYLDHTGGEHLFASAKAAVMPRVLFPDKPVLDDSEIVREYTGLEVSGADRATSINLGYFGELYADLGVLGMIAALALLGYALAVFELMFVRKIGQGPDANALSAVFVATFGAVVYSLPKLVAALLYTWLAAWLLLKFVYPRLRRRQSSPAYMRT